MASGFAPGENNLIVASKFARLARWRPIRFSVAADFSALEAKGRYNVRLDHAPKAGDGWLELLVAVAP
jgi:hypothetical protein